jgi:hypothetical protein
VFGFRLHVVAVALNMLELIALDVACDVLAPSGVASYYEWFVFVRKA